MTVIGYYFTLNSPWSYLGSQRLIAMAGRHGATVDLKPSKFGEIFDKTGGLPVAKRPPERRAYRMMELERWRRYLGVPIKLEPKFFPADETRGTRAVIAAKLAGVDALKFSSEIGRALWELEQNIADDGVLVAAAKRAGFDLDAVWASASPDSELDAIWEKNTAEALSRGVFGAPSYVLASGEIFWGQDRLELLDHELARH